MFVTKEDQRLYLTAWSYNSCRVLGCLADIIEEKGGDVEPYRHCMANNRSYEPEAEPVRIYGQSWICFMLDDVYYHISLDDNPFFEMHILKTPVVNGKRRRNVYMDEISRDWMYDCLFRVTTDEQAKAIAEVLLDIALKASMGEVYHESHKIQVPNTYDGGWHWETKYDPDKWLDAKRWAKY